MRSPDTQLAGEALPLVLAVALTCAGSVCAFAATALHLQPRAATSVPSVASTASAPPARAETGADAPTSTSPVATRAPSTTAPDAGLPVAVGSDAPASSIASAAPTAPPSVAASTPPVAPSSEAPPSAPPTASSGSTAPASAAPAAAPDTPCRLAVVQFKRGVKVPALSARAPLPIALAWLQADDRRRVLLRGHADARGADYFNMRLSASRARWIRRWLIGKGVEPARVTAQAFGEFLPVVDALPIDARQRRVEVFGLGGPCPKTREMR